MAKLDGVKVIDMTAGKIEKVAYEGAEYERAEHPIKKDDLILNVDDHEIDLTIGAFYKVISVDNFNDVQFLDDVDDGRDRHEDDIDFVPFRKVAVQDPTLEARVGKLESDVAALKGEQEAEEKPLAVGDYAKVVPHNNDIGFGGSPGDIVIIRDKRVDRYRTKELSGGDYHGNPWVKTEGLVRATDEEVAEAKAALKVGDYAKVVGRTYLGDIKTGTVVKITVDADEDGDYKIELLDGSDHDYAQASSLEKVDADKAETIEKWAKIGRGVNEYKEGDIVSGSGPFVLCAAGEVECVGDVLGVRRFDGTFSTIPASKATLIAPVESRVDR
ncbi:hypothetical protein [Shouchella clausii]|uniref:hypothetical protein n=1 Tax=Shouchella clausii TaxID=79880 RepID=UPI001652DD91|nr:hypothetical protein [Shouchella clausii]QNM43711.1 hypothetical protein DUT88_12765 [Shouchella clausii]